MLKNKVILITGGAGLLGQTFVEAVVKNNAIAIIADNDIENAGLVKMRLSKELKTQNIDSVALNITQKQSILDCIAIVERKYGKIDALINNAYPRNKNYGKHFFDVEYEDFCENTNLNIGGYFLTSQQFALFFKEQGFGNIINIASIYGVIAPKFSIYENTSMTVPVEYAAIKAALIHLTKYMAKYFKGLNIRVNTLSPGGIFDSQPEDFLAAYNDMCLNKGMLNKEDMQGSLVFLLSDSSININGQNLIVDDGFTI